MKLFGGGGSRLDAHSSHDSILTKKGSIGVAFSGGPLPALVGSISSALGDREPWDGREAATGIGENVGK